MLWEGTAHPVRAAGPPARGMHPLCLELRALPTSLGTLCLGAALGRGRCVVGWCGQDGQTPPQPTLLLPPPPPPPGCQRAFCQRNRASSVVIKGFQMSPGGVGRQRGVGGLWLWEHPAPAGAALLLWGRGSLL